MSGVGLTQALLGSAFLAACSALLRGGENLWRAVKLPGRYASLRVAVALASLVLGLIAAFAALACGQIPGLAWLGLLACVHLECVLAGGLENGGSDTMTWWHRLALSVIGLGGQDRDDLCFWVVYLLCAWVLASYACAGLAKLREPGWRSGQTLPVYLRVAPSKLGRRCANAPAWVFVGCSRGVIAMELASLVLWRLPDCVMVWLGVVAGFHVVNAALFGLHRFAWAWMATFPLLAWLLGG